MKKVSKKLKIIAIYELLGGALGFLLTLWLMIATLLQLFQNNYTQVQKVLLFTIITFALCIYAFIAYAGYRLYTGQKDGLTYSIIVNLLQIPQFSFFGFTYLVTSGLELSLKLASAGLKMNAYIGSKWNIFINPGDAFYIGVNVVALVIVCILLLEYKRRLQEQK